MEYATKIDNSLERIIKLGETMRNQGANDAFKRLLLTDPDAKSYISELLYNRIGEAEIFKMQNGLHIISYLKVSSSGFKILKSDPLLNYNYGVYSVSMLEGTESCVLLQFYEEFFDLFIEGYFESVEIGTVDTTEEIESLITDSINELAKKNGMIGLGKFTTQDGIYEIMDEERLTFSKSATPIPEDCLYFIPISNQDKEVKSNIYEITVGNRRILVTPYHKIPETKLSLAMNSRSLNYNRVLISNYATYVVMSNYVKRNYNINLYRYISEETYNNLYVSEYYNING